MPEVTIRLRINPETGKKDILISMNGDEDALPHEHEQAHRALVDKLLSGGLVKAEELGQVKREENQREAAPASNTPTQERQAQPQGGK